MVLNLRKFIEEIRFKNADIPGMSTAKPRPRGICRTTSCANCMASSTPLKTRPSSLPATLSAKPKSYLDGLVSAKFFRALMHYAQDGRILALPRSLRRRCVLKSPSDKCSTNSSARTCCVQTYATPWRNSAVA